MRGEKTNVGSGKTLESGPNDHVFIYFSDHGAKVIIAGKPDHQGCQDHGAKVIIADKPGHQGCQDHRAKVMIAGFHSLVTRVARTTGPR